MDFALDDGERAIQEQARRVAVDLVAPNARRADEERRFDRDLIRAVGAEGLFAGPVARRYGGTELSSVALALVYEELGRVDSSVRGFMAVQCGLVASCLQTYGSDAQKERWLPGLAKAEAIGCYALTEDEAGSDVASMQTRAVRDGDDWVISGAKVWITNGSVADVALVFAQADPEARHRGITAFCMPTDTLGFRRERMTAPELGHRGSDHARLRFDEVRVDDGHRMGDVGAGFKIAMAALDAGRLGVAAGAVGVHQACVDACVDFARGRRQFGRRIGDFQMVQQTLADMHASCEASRALTHRAAWERDRGLPCTRSTSVAKLFATEAAAKAAHDAVLLHGGRGYNSDFPVERYLRDIIGLEIYEGTSNIQRLIIARDLLGRDERP